MVARIKAPASINRALNYNEQKVQQGKAVLIHAEGFLKDKEHLLFRDKLERFQDLISLNSSKTNSLHISLNFDNADCLPEEKLIAIVRDYMEQIGFGKQPFLVYQHFDSGHPHVHIVTTTIRDNGTRIDTFNIGRNQSEKARRAIEISYGLVRADGRLQQVEKIKPVNAEKLQYGKAETRRAITNVLDAVLDRYKYTSLPELNAVLRQYNVVADRGSEGSRTYQRGGLVFRILDAKGQKVGVPIKASQIFSKPTLKYLKEKFSEHKLARQPHRNRIKNAIDLALLRRPDHSLQSLQRTLEKEHIQMVLWQNKQGLIYGITYVDHQRKVVFGGSDLGDNYSAAAMQARCAGGAVQLSSGQVASATSAEQRMQPADSQGKRTINALTGPLSSEKLPDIKGPIETLLQPDAQDEYVPGELKKNKKKKKKKQSIQ